MVEAGMTPAQALVASTDTAAQLLGLEGEVGLVEKGFVADLLVLSGNPIDDPIAFRKGLQVVVQSGRVVAR
jgi:imidazolonepropionase-like amidohydrolase